MEKTHLRSYLNQHCRFRLKSGKEVYGVIWEVSNGDKTEYYFSTLNEHNIMIRKADFRGISSSARVDLNDIVAAEKLVG